MTAMEASDVTPPDPPFVRGGEECAAIYKVGGSLLALGDLAQRLRRVLELRPDRRRLLVVGGGATADLVRGWDRLFGLGEERAHWLALRSLMLNEALVADLLPESRIVHSRAEAESAWWAGRIPILCAYSFLRAEERESGAHLPHRWEVTSDSIAAWVALRWPAEELVLLKSVPLPHGADDPPPVDRYFGELAPRLKRIGWVDLRSDALEVEEVIF